MRGKETGPHPTDKEQLAVQFESPGGQWNLFPGQISVSPLPPGSEEAICSPLGASQKAVRGEALTLWF